MKRFGGFYSGLLKERRAVSALLLIFALSLISAALHFLLLGNAKNGGGALLLLLILLLVPIAEKALGLRIPTAGYALLIFLTVGSLLGSCYDFYFKIPFWDTLLHDLSGFLFACIGYAFCKLLFPISRKRRQFPYLLFGIFFSLAIALLWELFEAGVTAYMLADMQEDTLLHSIKSFYLSGTHDYPLILEGITETAIHYGDGQILRIPGYLDLGLADTLSDMAVCLIGNLVFLLLFPLDKLFRGRLLPLILPKVL